MSRRMTVAAALVLGCMAAAVSNTTVAVSRERVSVSSAMGDRSSGGRRAGTVWVVNRDLGEVAVFDARTGSLVARQPTGAGAHEVAISDQAHRAVITNENDNTISILSTREPGAPVPVALGPRPHHVEVSRDGGTFAVGLVGTNAVALIDADTGHTTTYTSSDNPAAAAHGPYLRGRTLYVAHETGDEITAIDTDTGQIELSVGGISQPTEVLPDRHERLLYVSARGEDDIKVIDLRARRIVAEIPVGDQPETMLLTRDQHTLIVSIRGTPARLAFIDTRTRTLTATIDLAGPGTFGDLAAISADDRVVYATFDRGQPGTGGIAVVDTRTRTVIDIWEYPGIGRVHGIAHTSDIPRRP